MRSFQIVNTQIESLYKEQAVIFENISDGAIIHYQEKKSGKNGSDNNI